MANISTVNPGSADADFTTIQAWEDFADGETAADQWAKCFRGDLGALSIGAWTATGTATAFPRVYAAEGHRHDGTRLGANRAAKITHPGAPSAISFAGGTHYFEIDGINIISSSTTTANALLNIGTSTNSTNVLIKNGFYYSSGAAAMVGIDVNDSGFTYTFENMIVDMDNGANSATGVVCTAGTLNLVNSTVVDNGSSISSMGISVNSGQTLNANSCYVGDFGDNWVATGSFGGDYNAQSDADVHMPGASSTDNITSASAFTSASGDDFTLPNTSGLIGAGDPDNSTTADPIGTTRYLSANLAAQNNPDVGAMEFKDDFVMNTNTGGSQHREAGAASMVYSDDDNVFVFARDNTGVNVIMEDFSDIRGQVTPAVSSPIAIGDGAGTSMWDIWYDQWTPGFNSPDHTLIHVAWADGEGGGGGIFYSAYDTRARAFAVKELQIAPDGTLDNTTAADGFIDKEISIVKSRAGQIYIAANNDHGGGYAGVFYMSEQGGSAASFVPKTSPFEGVVDNLILQPGNETDESDIWAIYLDRSAQALTVKSYSLGSNTWTEGGASVLGAMIPSTTATQEIKNFAAVTRHRDNHCFVAWWNDYNTATADLKVTEVSDINTGDPKTDVLTNTTGAVGCAISMVNKTGPEEGDRQIYVSYLTGTPGTTTTPRFKVTNNDGDNWSAQQTWSNLAAADYRSIHTCPSIGNEGGLMSSMWEDVDSNDIFTNFFTAQHTKRGSAFDVETISVDQVLGMSPETWKRMRFCVRGNAMDGPLVFSSTMFGDEQY